MQVHQFSKDSCLLFHNFIKISASSYKCKLLHSDQFTILCEIADRTTQFK